MIDAGDIAQIGVRESEDDHQAQQPEFQAVSTQPVAQAVDRQVARWEGWVLLHQPSRTGQQGEGSGCHEEQQADVLEEQAHQSEQQGETPVPATSRLLILPVEKCEGAEAEREHPFGVDQLKEGEASCWSEEQQQADHQQEMPGGCTTH